MADKPSRGLVLYGDGLARFIEPSHPHLHSLASKANCGFLSLPNAPPSGSNYIFPIPGHFFSLFFFALFLGLLGNFSHFLIGLAVRALRSKFNWKGLM